mmetsp:Transcript_19907/g.63345  ORF Transcript_19907/g.63345 Transcript_19907/m.63345 type:complete len:237 (+) Transcript_19907:588-1298(+)
MAPGPQGLRVSWRTPPESRLMRYCMFPSVWRGRCLALMALTPGMSPKLRRRSAFSAHGAPSTRPPGCPVPPEEVGEEPSSRCARRSSRAGICKSSLVFTIGCRSRKRDRCSFLISPLNKRSLAALSRDPPGLPCRCSMPPILLLPVGMSRASDSDPTESLNWRFDVGEPNVMGIFPPLAMLFKVRSTTSIVLDMLSEGGGAALRRPSRSVVSVWKSMMCGEGKTKVPTQIHAESGL